MLVGSSVVHFKPQLLRTCVIMDPIHIHSRTTLWRAIISALFEDIATKICSVDLQDIMVFTHSEHLTSLGMTFVWVREIPNISKTFQNTCRSRMGIEDAGQCWRRSWCVMGPNSSSLCRDRTSPYQSYISSTERYLLHQSNGVALAQSYI